MRTEAILQRAMELGITLTVVGERIQYRPKSAASPEFVKLLQEHKGEVMAHLRQQLKDHYELAFPGDKAGEEELAELEWRVHEQGYVLCYSQWLDDFIAFRRDDIDLHTIPPGFVAYSDTELKLLFGESRPDWSLKALKLIHQAKRAGAKVMDVHDDAAP